MDLLRGPEPKFKSWKDLVAVLATVPFEGWIFRGLPAYEFHPVSKLERVLDVSGLPQDEWLDAEKRALGYFKRRARQWLSNTPSDQDLLGWWSLMQHYGAPTRLTDWTASPLVACYFAYETTHSDAKPQSAVLWMLDAGACRASFGWKNFGPWDHVGASPMMKYADGALVSKSYPGRETTIDTIAADETDLIRRAIERGLTWPLPLPIVRPDRRMYAQQACFVCVGKLGCRPPVLPYLLDPGSFPADAEGVSGDASVPEIPKTFDGIIEQPDGTCTALIRPINEPPGRIIKKVELPYEWRHEALATLERMNITADSLFPGLDGVGRATEMYLRRMPPNGVYSLWEDLKY
jgi:hypothetical protein